MKIADVIWGCKGGYSLAIGSRENGRIVFEIRCDIAEEEYVCGIEIEPHQRKRLIAAINAEQELQEKIKAIETKLLRSCNLHSDCDAADANWLKSGRVGQRRVHCHEADCEDCYGR